MRTLIILLIGFLLNRCVEPPSSPPEVADTSQGDPVIRISRTQFEASNMKLDSLRRKPFSRILPTTGIIDVPPENKVSVSTYYGGYIQGLRLLPGEYVRKGQVLFRLENPEFVQMQQAYWEAQSQLAYLKSDYERQQTLAEENINSQKQLLKAESDYKRTLAQYEGLKKKLELIHLTPDSLDGSSWQSSIPIYAPISGYITEIPITQGKYLAPAALALEITSTQHLHLELEVFEKDLPYLRKDQPLEFYLPEQPDTLYPGHIYLIGKNIDPAKRTLRVHAHLDDEDAGRRFVPGMYIEARIATDFRTNWALPETAIVSLEGISYCLLQRSRTQDALVFEQISLRTGATQDGWVEIIGIPSNLQNASFLAQGAFALIQE